MKNLATAMTEMEMAIEVEKIELDRPYMGVLQRHVAKGKIEGLELALGLLYSHLGELVNEDSDGDTGGN